MDIKELIAQYDDMEAENGMNIQESEEVNEEVVNEEDALLADKEGRLTVCINELYDLEEKAIAEENMDVAQAIKDARIYADDVRSDLYHSEVNETKELAGEKVEYLFDVQVTMDAENEMSNAFVKTEIQRAIENALDKYDVKVSVQNA